MQTYLSPNYIYSTEISLMITTIENWSFDKETGTDGAGSVFLPRINDNTKACKYCSISPLMMEIIVQMLRILPCEIARVMMISKR